MENDGFRVPDFEFSKEKGAILNFTSDWMIPRMAEVFLNDIDKRVMTELDRTPMKRYINMQTKEYPTKKLLEEVFMIMVDFGQANTIATALALNPATYARLIAIYNHDYHDRANYAENYMPCLPGVDLITCNRIPEGELYFVSNRVQGLLLLTDKDDKPHVEYDKEGARALYIDVYHQVTATSLPTYTPAQQKTQQSTNLYQLANIKPILAF